MSGRDPQLPAGVQVMPLVTHADPRGHLTELLRTTQHPSPAPVQWNAVKSEAGVMRGVHVHKVHWDYFFLLAGEMLLGLHDMRTASPTYRRSAIIPLTGEELKSVVIPPGVAHGFYYPRASMHVYSVSEYWDPADELGCCWNSPELDLAWPCSDPALSERDRSADSYDSLASVISGTRWQR
jgi:dTDP-4-dehydrorhamnose 3,5-epimerase